MHPLRLIKPDCHWCMSNTAQECQGHACATCIAFVSTQVSQACFVMLLLCTCPLFDLSVDSQSRATCVC